MRNKYKEKYYVEYTVLVNVINKVLWYEKEIMIEDEMSSIGAKALTLKKKYKGSYVVVKVS